MLPLIPSGPGFALTPTQSAFGTALTGLVPPWPGCPGNSGSMLYNLINGRPNWWDSGMYSHITTLLYTTSTTAHTLNFLRPLNWTTFKTAVAKNATAITLSDDPGVYSTNFRYVLPGQTFNPPGTANAAGVAPVQVTDAAISSTNKYVAYQLDDGTWQLDTLASGTFGGGNLVLTTGTPNRNGATIAAGRPLFYFGATSLSVPQTGNAHLLSTTIASTNKAQQIGDYNGAGIPALNPGDPLVVISNNITATGIIDLIAGDYRKY